MKKKKHKSNLKSMSIGESAEYIKKALGYSTLVKPPEFWLDTGSRRLNAVLGSKKLGLAYGKMITIAGPPSSGKSVLAAKIAALAQEDNADPAWVDGENSFDHKHVGKQGLDCGEPILDKDENIIGYEKVALFRPEYGTFKYKDKKKKVKLIAEDVESAEDVFTRVETWMKLRRKVNRDGKLVVVVDSTTSFAPEEEWAAGLNEQNMRTRSSNAVFLNLLAKRWVSLALHTNALIIFIAQLRTNPKQMFGNPEYVTGGKGILYYPSVVAWVRRVKGGEIISAKRQVGVQGVIANKKNKAGGGSVERKKCGYRCYFYKDRWKFMGVDEIKGKEKEQ